ncbi:FliM/FliN family flagellar motor switch protein [Undibacterium sp. Di27W]|uniref:FliM/FliN family flagellar motor switch protein n=1 Tax=Undibacterium sp. Di27W TaxID=3413036 RepID=UPI003BEFD0F6
MSEATEKKQVAMPDTLQKMRWWSALHLDLISGRFDALNAAWDKDWLASGESKAARAMLASEGSAKTKESASWRVFYQSDKPFFWLQLPTKHLDHVQEALFADAGSTIGGSKSKGNIGKSVASCAWEDYLVKLTELLVPANTDIKIDSPAQHLYKAWSGAVQVHLQWCGMTLMLLLSQTCVEQLLGKDLLNAEAEKRSISHKPPKSKLAPLMQAMQHKKVRIRVELSPCEIEIGNLQQIQVGDVIPLPHGLEQALQVKFASGEILCQAYLGVQGQKKAIEIMMATPLNKTVESKSVAC